MNAEKPSPIRVSEQNGVGGMGARSGRMVPTNEDGPEGATNTPGPSRRVIEGDVD